MGRLPLALGIAITASGLAAQGPTLPPILRRGLDAYSAHGPDSAVTTWLKGSPAVTDVGAVSSTVAALERIQQAYGKMIGSDALSRVPLGAHVARYYVVLLFEHGPVFSWFDVYDSPAGTEKPCE